jgi:hypothetical protein
MKERSTLCSFAAASRLLARRPVSHGCHRGELCMAARRSATEASKLPSRSFFFFFLLLFFFHFVLNSLFSHSPIVEKKKTL